MTEEVWFRVCIGLLAFCSYIAGVYYMLTGHYEPKVYSRVIWLLLAINGLGGLIASGSDKSAIILAATQSFGSLIVMLVAFKFSRLEFGLVEWIASVLLIVSGAVWIMFDIPELNVAISLVAHFIGGVPTVIEVVRNPSSERPLFWLFFGAASFATVLAADKTVFTNYMFPLYFALFNGSIILLSQRKGLQL